MEDKKEITPRVLDLGAKRKGQLNESFLAQFGGLAQIALERMFGMNDTPILFKGNKREIESFYKTLQNERDYLEDYSKYGLDNASTYQSRSTLNKAIKNFERDTGLEWPFKD